MAARSTPAELTGRVASLPTREQINLPVQEQLIVELYTQVVVQLPSCQPIQDVELAAGDWHVRSVPPPAAFQTCGGRRGT